MLLVCLLEVGHLRDAGRTRREPEVQNNRLAFELGQGDGVPRLMFGVGVEGQLEIGGGIGVAVVARG